MRLGGLCKHGTGRWGTMTATSAAEVFVRESGGNDVVISKGKLGRARLEEVEGLADSGWEIEITLF